MSAKPRVVIYWLILNEKYESASPNFHTLPPTLEHMGSPKNFHHSTVSNF